MPSSRATSATEPRPVRLRVAALGRLPATVQERLLAVGELQGEILSVSRSDYRVIRPQTGEPATHRHWPIWARLIRSRRTVEDRGVGDTLERTVGLFGSEDFRFWFYCVFGASKRPCPACPAKWNRAFPYGPLTVG